MAAVSTGVSDRDGLVYLCVPWCPSGDWMCCVQVWECSWSTTLGTVCPGQPARAVGPRARGWAQLLKELTLNPYANWGPESLRVAKGDTTSSSDQYLLLSSQAKPGQGPGPGSPGASSALLLGLERARWGRECPGGAAMAVFSEFTPSCACIAEPLGPPL